VTPQQNSQKVTASAGNSNHLRYFLERFRLVHLEHK
jgi:hypothetical protein